MMSDSNHRYLDAGRFLGIFATRKYETVPMNGEGDIKMDFLMPEKEKWYLIRQQVRLGTHLPDERRSLTRFF